MRVGKYVYKIISTSCGHTRYAIIRRSRWSPIWRIRYNAQEITYSIPLRLNARSELTEFGALHGYYSRDEALRVLAEDIRVLSKSTKSEELSGEELRKELVKTILRGNNHE